MLTAVGWRRRASDFERAEYQCVTNISRADPMIFSGVGTVAL